MTKKISLWLAIFLVIFAMVITFQLTIVFGDVFFRDEPAGQVPPDYTEKTEEPTVPDEPAEKTLGEEITERVAAKIGAIMGQEVGESVREVAFVKCAGTCENANADYEYYGVEDCSMMAFVPNGGPKKCNFGCLGFGECVKACPFDAIHIKNGVAVVDKEQCKACGKCIKACPKNLIELVPYDAKHIVQCSSQDKGKQVMTACKVGCIGCKMCERVCESGAVTVENNIAHIDQSKCTGCGACAEKCPKKIITGKKVTA